MQQIFALEKNFLCREVGPGRHACRALIWTAPGRDLQTIGARAPSGIAGNNSRIQVRIETPCHAVFENPGVVRPVPTDDLSCS